MRTKYEVPEMNMIEFMEKDVITSSGLSEVPPDTLEGNNEWGDLF